MEPKGPATVSNDGPGDQSEALNQNRAHREHTGIPRCPADDSRYRFCGGHTGIGRWP